MADDDFAVVVIDNGTGTIKAGFAGSETPDVIFPTVVGRPKYQGNIPTHNDEDEDYEETVYVGDASAGTSAVLTISSPIKRGLIDNWDDMTKIWQHTFENELRVDPYETPVLLTEAPLNPRINREKTTQIFFETFNVPGFFVEVSAILSLFSTGRTTGLVFESGDGVSQVVPIYEGFALQHATERHNFAGSDLSLWMQKILGESGLTLTSFSEKEIARSIKEKLSYVALDYQAELEKAKTSNQCEEKYTLPDGNVIIVNEERFRCTELLFHPEMDHREIVGFHEAIFNAIMKTDIDIRRDLYKNVVLSGGSTVFPGLPERLEQEIVKLAPPAVTVKVSAPKERKYAAWIGGSMFAALDNFVDSCVTQAEYDECGPIIVERKCL
ncbi:Actin, nonmuscle [Tritrichomonas foetus]|uniref:Actin, nonmuscle n=1 Tax=Tritrichomonas foetus TaxID=1144522 RepID=A0A1J4KRE0_9EUKA|nr:Actin, nonmuscle [Tritrichomonas foetus]|eukprot:OHT12230.1 Actin, nonmuscle [Tritrichomonas foetus]